MENTKVKTKITEELQEKMETQELQEKMLADELLEDIEEMAEAAENKNYSRPNFWKDNRGVGVIEIVLILVVLIGLVLVFKEQITSIVNNAFTAISGDAGEIIN